FGLAQLYQLRGRVGRSGRRAYAYFLYDPRRSLTEQADKRLDVISGLHELGQGFKIALRDLEIRGAGNLLGTEQHGAIAAVGFEMYLQMLQSAVSMLRTGSEETAVTDVLSTAEMNLDLPLDHFIPRSYIRDEKLRLGAYRQLAGADDEADLDSMLRSLKDRYGTAPPQLDNRAYSLRVTLRAPGGCPWDREQTHESLRQYLLEETYELLEAIDAGDDAKMMEELGDLLLQIAMHAEIAAEEGRFDATQVSEAVAAKMVKRHPHVFGDMSVANAHEVLRNWEHQKISEAREAGNEESVVDRVPSTLPALAWALGLQKRAARVGFDFASPAAAAGSVGGGARGVAGV